MSLILSKSLQVYPHVFKMAMNLILVHQIDVQYFNI